MEINPKTGKKSLNKKKLYNDFLELIKDPVHFAYRNK